MSPERTVLIVSRYFPPAFDVGGRRAYHFARYLPEHGFRPVVVTAREPEPSKRDPAPLELPATVRLIREYEPPGHRSAGTRLSDGTLAAPVVEPRGRGRLLQRFGRQLAFPLGSDLRLVPHLRRTLLHVIDTEHPDVIFASSSPYATLIAAELAGRARGIPVCLDLRDPWSLNFLQRDKAGWVRASEAWLEHRLFTRASRITVTSEATAEAYRRLYPDLPLEHITTIHNAFDPSRRPLGGPKEGPLRLVHFGNCYGPRSLSTILRAVAALTKQRPDLRLKLLNLGRVSERDLVLAAELGIADSFEHRPVVPYDEGIELLARSDLAILLAYGEETLFIPAKFYDYLLAGSPVLCVSLPSELTALVGELGAGSSVAPDDVDGAVAAIEAALLQRASGAPRRIDAQRAARFSAPIAAAKLAEVLEQVVGSRSALA